MPRQSGFSLVAAIFVLIVVTLVVVGMARLAGNQHGTLSLGVQQARAYQAARAGLEWAVAQANAGQCAASASISLQGSSLAEFDGVQVNCIRTAYNGDDGSVLGLYQLTAQAQNGAPGSRPDYAFRRLSALVEGP